MTFLANITLLLLATLSHGDVTAVASEGVSEALSAHDVLAAPAHGTPQAKAIALHAPFEPVADFEETRESEDSDDAGALPLREELRVDVDARGHSKVGETPACWFSSRQRTVVSARGPPTRR